MVERAEEPHTARKSQAPRLRFQLLTQRAVADEVESDVSIASPSLNASSNPLWFFTGTSVAMHAMRSGTATDAPFEATGMSIPMWITCGRASGTTVATRAAPDRLITRVKHAAEIFCASRLSAAMSQRWRVMLQGVPVTSQATIATVELAPPQWTWTCSGLRRRITSISAAARGRTATFRARTAARPLADARTARRASSEGAEPAPRSALSAACRTPGDSVIASKSRAYEWTLPPLGHIGKSKSSAPLSTWAATSGPMNPSPGPNGKRDVT